MLNGVQGMPPCRQSARSNLREDPGILQTRICLPPDAMVEVRFPVSQTGGGAGPIRGTSKIVGSHARVERSVEIAEALRGGGHFWNWQPLLGWHLRPVVALTIAACQVVQYFLVYAILAVLALHRSEELVARSDDERIFRF